MFVWRKSDALSCNHCCREKLYVLRTYFECVFVALVTVHAEYMLHIIFSSVACPAVPYISTLSDKRYDFRGGGIIEREMCVLTSCTAPVWHNSRVRLSYIYDSWCLKVKVPLILLIKTWIFSSDFRNILVHQILWKIRQVGAELRLANRRTDKPTWRS
jgi:hypothetical protein